MEGRQLSIPQKHSQARDNPMQVDQILPKEVLILLRNSNVRDIAPTWLLQKGTNKLTLTLEWNGDKQISSEKKHKSPANRKRDKERKKQWLERVNKKTKLEDPSLPKNCSNMPAANGKSIESGHESPHSDRDRQEINFLEQTTIEEELPFHGIENITGILDTDDVMRHELNSWKRKFDRRVTKDQENNLAFISKLLVQKQELKEQLKQGDIKYEELKCLQAKSKEDIERLKDLWVAQSNQTEILRGEKIKQAEQIDRLHEVLNMERNLNKKNSFQKDNLRAQGYKNYRKKTFYPSW